MITEHHFPTMIYIKDFPDSEKLNQYLEPKIIQWSQQDKGEQKTNAGGWHSKTNMNQKEEYNPLTRELFNMQEEIYQKEHLSLKPVCGNMWANINGPGNFNRPKEGKLPPELWREVHYEPKAGRCIMFPSWLWHEVKPNKSNDTRISVSFNFLQR